MYVTCFVFIVDHKKYIVLQKKLEDQRFIANLKKQANIKFHKFINFNSVLISSYGLVWIWGITGMKHSYETKGYFHSNVLYNRLYCYRFSLISLYVSFNESS